MANIKSAKKRVLVNNAKAARNKAVRSDLRTALKKANLAVENNADDKEAVVKAAIKKVDKACAKGIIHKNNASRKKASLAKSLAK
ncbi:small subunit ribosomal protein S20 [Ruminococcus sp. YE71]|uniref:30S ribosomal protein S20 n=1 Tax=unclassified Ruminococcus TaxID=2608920 RepID=UPI00087EB601|nr:MULTISPECIES: 30S ribosomal protein S20 [unclassified Ruminococcus]SDA18651.1 small subunit ribosomal protein S20 [Ruminococcus sp. YE78]SFW29530.1 small subunit ribosomal protein S20 [Ruminococcus sp. YE71]